MSRSEFRWNKKRKHYAYLFKDKGKYVLNIVITTKPFRLVHGKEKSNIMLVRHPNPKCNKSAYVIPFVYVDDFISFFEKVYKWDFDVNDKRKIKKIKREKLVTNEKPTVSSHPFRVGFSWLSALASI